MNAIEILNLTNAGLNLLEELVPVIQNFKPVEISPEQQQLVLDRYQKLRGDLDAAFSGPEWQIQK